MTDDQTKLNSLSIRLDLHDNTFRIAQYEYSQFIPSKWIKHTVVLGNGTKIPNFASLPI
jgi:hypothetical protein